MRVAIHWFRNRKGLRLHDNPALLHACKNVDTMIPLYILDPSELSPLKCGDNRTAFFLECLANLDLNLKKKGSRLFVVLGSPSEVLPIIIKKYKVDLLTFEVDDEPAARRRDKEITTIAKEAGVTEVTSF